MYKSMKRLLLSSICVFVLTGCDKSEPKPITSISIPTGDLTGAIFNIGQNISTVWNENLTYIDATASSSQGGLDNLSQIYTKDNVISFSVTSIAYEAYTGTGNFKDNKNEKLRVIAGLYYNPNQIVVKDDEDINSLNDLIGKTFSPGAIGSTTVVEAYNHFNALEINMEDSIHVVNAGFSDSITLMENNELDGTWIMAGIPNDAVDALTQNTHGKLIEIDDSTLDVLQYKYPWYAKYIIPAGTYYNQKEDIQTSAVKLALVTSSDLDEEIVYDLTKTLWEHMTELKKTNPALCSVSVESNTTDLANLPLHDGAIEYYKEIGIIK